METVAPLQEIIDELRRAGGDTFKYCYACGKCDTVCPWNRVRSFSIRKLVQQASFGLSEIELEELWRCTTCGTCPAECPRGVGQIDVGTAVRRVAAQYGVFPGCARPVGAVRGSLSVEGNPLGEERDKRDAWARPLGVRPFAEGMEVLYFVGCYYSYDPRLKKAAAATARILTRAGVDFGILGAQETCCGESIRKTGNEEVFRKLARDNIKTFIDRGVKKIVVSSPHCFQAFKHDYPEFMVHFEVVHMSQLLLQLVEQGRLRLSGGPRKIVTWHDPCYLGRHNGIYDEPRALLRSIPGLELVEMPDTRERSFCCGGGGGRIWMDTPPSERFASLRLRQAASTGASVLATSCPYCISNFEDARLSADTGQDIPVKDVTEVIEESLAPEEQAP